MSINPIQNSESGASVRAKLNTVISEVNGLGDSATRDVGTGSGDVAAGDHGHDIADVSGLEAALAARVVVVDADGNADAARPAGALVVMWINSKRGIAPSRFCA